MNGRHLATLQELPGLLERFCIACICREEIRGTGSCSGVGTEQTAIELLVSPSAVITLILVVGVALAIGARSWRGRTRGAAQRSATSTRVDGSKT
ncbi:hypothetical protein [Microbacterium sp. KNMS]